MEKHDLSIKRAHTFMVGRWQPAVLLKVSIKHAVSFRSRNADSFTSPPAQMNFY